MARRIANTEVVHGRYQMIERLLAAQPQGSTLPALRFFEPKPSFTNFMRSRFSGQLIYDIGAGCGHVAEALAMAGLNITAFDLSHRANAWFPVEIGNAITWNYEPGSVAMFCRPCHGVFVEASIERLRHFGVSTVIYAGLAHNVDADLGIFRRYFKCVLTHAGRDNESVYIWQIPESALKPYQGSIHRGVIHNGRPPKKTR